MDDFPLRKRMRLSHYDYSQNGAYFVTVCTKDTCNFVLSYIRRGDPCGRPEIALTPLGTICQQAFQSIENTFMVTIDTYSIMPNHVHFIVSLSEDHKNKGDRKGHPYGLGAIVGGYKSLVANEWLKICKSRNVFMGYLWQRNYYEHVIRDEADYQIRWKYIAENPAKWLESENFFSTNL